MFTYWRQDAVISHSVSLLNVFHLLAILSQITSCKQIACIELTNRYRIAYHLLALCKRVSHMIRFTISGSFYLLAGPALLGSFRSGP
jgi:hypothetical protein